MKKRNLKSLHIFKVISQLICDENVCVKIKVFVKPSGTPHCIVLIYD